MESLTNFLPNLTEKKRKTNQSFLMASEVIRLTGRKQDLPMWCRLAKYNSWAVDKCLIRYKERLETQGKPNNPAAYFMYLYQLYKGGTC